MAIIAQIVSVRHDAECPNCGTTQTQTSVLYFDFTNQKFQVTKTCKCQDVDNLENPYSETYEVGAPQV